MERTAFSHTWEVEQMSQATRPNDRHIIWSNQNLDVDDWREDYKEFLEANELDDDPNDEQALYEWMEETNYDYLSDERVNLNVQLSQPIIVIGDIGRWNGRVMGYKDIPSGNIRDCLYADTDYTEWYVDKYGDLRADATHHDGTNHYLYRVFKDGVSETQMENLRDKIYHGKATRADITRLTRRLGDEIAAVYGFDIPKQRTPQVDLFMNIEKIEKAERLDQCIETIRQRFGKNSIRNGILFQNLRMPSEKPEITMPTGVLC